MTVALYLVKELTFACGLGSMVTGELSWNGGKGSLKSKEEMSAGRSGVPHETSESWGRRWVFDVCACVRCVSSPCLIRLPAVFCVPLAFLKDEIAPEQIRVLCYVQIVP